MAMVMTVEQARSRQIRIEGDGTDIKGGVCTTPLFGTPGDRDKRDAPQAFLSEADQGRFTRAHFHALDQFQLLIGGGVKVGRHEMAPCSVHFARAYTPYGPLKADDVSGMAQLVLRPFHDPMGPLRIPDKQSILRDVSDRRPWQAYSSGIDFAVPAAEYSMQPIAGLNQNGVTAYTLSVKPNTEVAAPDPAASNGQYIAVIQGDLIHENVLRSAVALVYVRPNEDPYCIKAGPSGLKAVVLGFPRAGALATAAAAPARGEAWRCLMCAFLYDVAQGLPADAVTPGTPWHALPEGWTCPNCSSAKALFARAE